MSRQFAKCVSEFRPERWILRSSASISFVGVFLGIIAPVLLIAGLGYRQLHHSLTEMALERQQSLAHLSALALDSRLDNLIEVGLSVASWAQFREQVEADDWEGAIRLLEQIPSELPYLERIFLSDLEGVLRADTPPLPGVRGESFAHRDWYRGASSDWTPYISETYVRSAHPPYRVVAAAIPIRSHRNEEGEEAVPPIGILVLQIRVAALVEWSGEIFHGSSGSVYFVDQKGQVVAHPEPGGEDGENLLEVPIVQRVLRGERGVMELPCPFTQQKAIGAFEPVSDYGWGVVAQQPTHEVFQGREDALRGLLLRNGLILLLSGAVGGFIIIGLATVRRYATEIEDLYDRAPCGYHSLDAEGVFLRMNETERQWLGYTSEELLGRKKFTDLLTAEGCALFRQRFSEFKERGKVSDLQFDLVCKDGSILPVLLNATVIRDKAGRFLMSRSTLFDMSELKRTQIALETANAELEAFSYSVSHDLRSPLRGIDGFSLALMEDCSEKLSPEELDHLRRIRDATGRMGRLIDDLLNLSRVSRAQMTNETVDLSAMAYDIIAELKEHEPHRRVEARIAEGLVSECDPRLMRVALGNLLENAWKFTSDRETARIEFGKENHRHGDPTFFVNDNGAGFDIKYVDKLFGAFQRLHSDRDFPGTGIGLATVQRIIRRHGGWIRAEGKPGEGATFRFRIHDPYPERMSSTRPE